MAYEVVLCVAENKLDAQMFVEMLNREGIPAYFKNNAGTQFMEYAWGDLNQPQTIIVSSDFVEQAKKLAVEFGLICDKNEESK